jgi:glycerol-3-phosphate dehydrogenase (NAD(P)+)
MSVIGVLGGGSWGTVLADLLTRAGHDVRLWAYEAEVVEAVNTTHSNPVFLPGAALDDRLKATDDPTEAIRAADCVLAVSPSHVTRQVLQRVAPVLLEGALIACATKGIETETLKLMHEVAAEVLPSHRFVALSGPSFAREVFAGEPTAVVAASADPGAAEAVQHLFTTATFRVYSNPDVVGTELAGAVKNVIAIAAGIAEGLGLGHNPRAALVTRGLAEITRLGLALGAEARTFAGLAGMGDLILTTSGQQSRNRSLGVALAQGTSLEAHQGAHKSVAEGVNTARAAVRLAARHGVELPITAKVHAILFDGLDPRQAIGELMIRTPKPEQWT